MENNKTYEILIPQQTFKIFTNIWAKSLPVENYDFLNEQNNLKLIDKDNWLSLNADKLFALCLNWKQKFLGGKPDKNSGSLEWLMCILRHNTTNYDSVLEHSADCHAWAPGFGTLLRLEADCLVISYLRKNGLYDQIIRKCQEEWMWRNSK